MTVTAYFDVFTFTELIIRLNLLAVALFTTGVGTSAVSTTTTRATTTSTTTRATSTTTTTAPVGTGTAAAYAQCGGTGWSGSFHVDIFLCLICYSFGVSPIGPTICVSGWKW